MLRGGGRAWGWLRGQRPLTQRGQLGSRNPLAPLRLSLLPRAPGRAPSPPAAKYSNLSPGSPPAAPDIVSRAPTAPFFDGARITAARGGAAAPAFPSGTCVFTPAFPPARARVVDCPRVNNFGARLTRAPVSIVPTHFLAARAQGSGDVVFSSSPGVVGRSRDGALTQLLNIYGSDRPIARLSNLKTIARPERLYYQTQCLYQTVATLARGLEAC